VEAASPWSLKVVTAGVPICAKFQQLVPVPALDAVAGDATLSVEAVHARFICNAEAAVPSSLWALWAGGVRRTGVLALAVLE